MLAGTAQQMLTLPSFGVVRGSGVDIRNGCFPNMPDARWLRMTKHETGEVLVGSDSPLPQELQADVESLLPEVLAFTDSDRSLRTEYNLQDRKEWNNAVRNLAQLAGFSIDELYSPDS